jgi:hypothetical protein
VLHVAQWPAATKQAPCAPLIHVVLDLAQNTHLVEVLWRRVLPDEERRTSTLLLPPLYQLLQVLLVCGRVVQPRIDHLAVTRRPT